MGNNWKTTAKGLNREFRFKTFTELAKFLLEVAKKADEMNHHPDLEVSKAVMLSANLFSHDVKSVTDRDHRLSAAMDEIYLSFTSR